MKLISILSDWYFSRKTLPHWGVLMLDCFIVLFASFVGKYYELDDIGFTHSFRSIVIGALITTLLYAISFIFCLPLAKYDVSFYEDYIVILHKFL